MKITPNTQEEIRMVNNNTSCALHHLIILNKGGDAIVQHLRSLNWESGKVVASCVAGEDVDGNMFFVIHFEDIEAPLKAYFYTSRVRKWLGDCLHNRIEKIVWK